MEIGIHYFSSWADIAQLGLGLGKRLGFMSGLTLPAAVARGRHWKLTPNHVECLLLEVKICDGNLTQNNGTIITWTNNAIFLPPLRMLYFHQHKFIS